MATSDWQPNEIDDTATEFIEEDPIAFEEDSIPYDEPAEAIEEIERGLGFTDGFQFGCGFWSAALVVGVIAGLGFLILTFFLSFAGVSLF